MLDIHRGHAWNVSFTLGTAVAKRSWGWKTLRPLFHRLDWLTVLGGGARIRDQGWL